MRLRELEASGCSGIEKQGDRGIPPAQRRTAQTQEKTNPLFLDLLSVGPETRPSFWVLPSAVHTP